MPRNAVRGTFLFAVVLFAVVLIDVGLAVGRVFALPDVLTIPGFALTVGSLLLSLVAALALVIWATNSICFRAGCGRLLQSARQAASS